MTLDFNKIEKKYIKVLISIKLTYPDSNINHIRKLYNYEAVHFENNYEFLIQSKILKENGSFNDNQLERMESVIHNDYQFNNLLLEIIISKNSIYCDYVGEYLKNFKLNNDELTFKPFSKKRIKYSGIRNLLSEFGLLRLGQNYTYYINSVHVRKILRIIKQSIITPKKLKSILNQQEQIGLLAELKIVEFEQERLKDIGIVNDVEHVALKDVSLGYDIKSWETIINERYIEVKAVSKLDYKFHWSKNEIEISEKYGDKYYLYLLPVINSKTFDIDLLNIIKNPYDVIFSTNSDYNKNIEQYSIWK